MSKQQLAAILEMSAQNPIPANATPAVMREGMASMKEYAAFIKAHQA